jgi:hypothetical protein
MSAFMWEAFFLKIFTQEWNLELNKIIAFSALALAFQSSRKITIPVVW